MTKYKILFVVSLIFLSPLTFSQQGDKEEKSYGEHFEKKITIDFTKDSGKKEYYLAQVIYKICEKVNVPFLYKQCLQNSKEFYKLKVKPFYARGKAGLLLNRILKKSGYNYIINKKGLIVKPKTPPKMVPMENFEHFDKNKDGRISKSEVSEESWNKLLVADTNQDGVVTIREIGEVYSALKNRSKFSQIDEKVRQNKNKITYVNEFDLNFKQNLRKFPNRKLAKFNYKSNRKISWYQPINRFFKRFDKNNDGRLSQREIPAPAWERLSRIDVNKDNVITIEEYESKYQPLNSSYNNKFSKFLEKPDPKYITPKKDYYKKKDYKSKQYGMKSSYKYGQYKQKNIMDKNYIFKYFDKNRDGKLSKYELPERFWNSLKYADKNKDNLISKQELNYNYNYMKQQYLDILTKQLDLPKDILESFIQFDYNRDGKIKMKEVPSYIWNMVAQFDINRDNVITKQELKKILSKLIK